MIIGLDLSFPADAIEARLPDIASARALLVERRPDILALLKRRRAIFQASYGDPAGHYIERAEAATILAIARMGLRHGGFGDDFHAYHNEDHVIEILDRRIGRVLGQEGVGVLPALDWLALSLFASCHDLRQRETISFKHGIGNNEAASIAETHRILDIAGFDRRIDEDLYVALEVMIAGSTFDASPRPSQYNTAEVVATGGPLAPHLVEQMDATWPDWRNNPKLERAVRLAQIASDLDTANVGERFVELAASAARLAAEREMRAGRSLRGYESGAPVLGFLTDGQERYFFELHRFCSPLGEAVFGRDKANNAPRVRALAAQLRERFGALPPDAYTGEAVLDAHLTLAETL